MIHSKDYVEARKHAQALTELQKLVEADVINGKQIFLEKGYIPFSLETRICLFLFRRNHYTCCMNDLNDWLSSWGWEMKVNEEDVQKTYALFAVES